MLSAEVIHPLHAKQSFSVILATFGVDSSSIFYKNISNIKMNLKNEALHTIDFLVRNLIRPSSVFSANFVCIGIMHC